ncbi:MAG: hypothetical protein M3546_08985 [Actinomycetota bacterium]|nr:hypothetical protein [Actinomycetota bacterium]
MRSCEVRQEALTVRRMQCYRASGKARDHGYRLASIPDSFDGFSVLDLEPNTRRLFEDAGFLLFVSGTLAAILLVVAVSLAALRHAVIPRWLGWVGFPVAVLLPLAIAFVGYLVLVVWMLTVSATLARRGPRSTRPS